MISFGGINIHELMDFSLIPTNKIFLVHTCAHTLFSKGNSFEDVNRVKLIHDKIVKEMVFRHLNHEKFDKLDD
jgi:hypothetical protein